MEKCDARHDVEEFMEIAKIIGFDSVRVLHCLAREYRLLGDQ
jgi:hypothetical protein